MANAVYPLMKNSFMNGDTNTSMNVDTTTDGPYTALTDTGTHAYSAADQFYSSVVAATVGTEQRIVSPTVGTVADAVFDGSDLTFTAVTGASVEALTIYRHNSGANTTWRLVLFIDTATGLPVTPNGGDITVTWDAQGIFKL